MPELPEVETTKRLLEMHIVKQTIQKIILNRPNLRFDFPSILTTEFNNVAITELQRLGKYMLWHCDNGYTLIIHLGMTGRFLIADTQTSFPDFYHDNTINPVHAHCIFQFTNGKQIIYYDPRRFGFFDCIRTNNLYSNKFLKILGIDGLNLLGQETKIFDLIRLKQSPIKNILLDQSIIAGVGNIYASEALWRAKIHPETKGNMLKLQHIILLVQHINDILTEAIIGSGSTLKDYRTPTGETGNYQNVFRVYDRTSENCVDIICKGTVQKIMQSNRASFFCDMCQVY